MRFGRARALTVALVAVLVGVSACTNGGGDPVPTGQPPSSTAGPGSAAGSPSSSAAPASEAPLGKVTLDRKASLAVSPVDDNGRTLVSATFGTASAKRPVSLQQRVGSAWKEVATGAQDRHGHVEFLAPTAAGAYRAVALEWTNGSGTTRTAVATPTAEADEQWRNTLSSDFSGSSMPSPWGERNVGSYLAGGRQCSAPYPSNVKFAKGNAVLSMTKETSAANKKKADAAGCTKGEYYRNAMISTEGRFGVHTGMVAARVKFPAAQGMHGSVWLQSQRQNEIDFVESYGYGWGLTSVIHVDHKRYPAKTPETYVNTEAVKDRAWWDEYHVYSVEWDRSELVFRIDGVETKRIVKSTPDTEYFLVISLLSSDWELKRLTDPVQWADNVGKTTLPQSMSVDWVKVWTRK